MRYAIVVAAFLCGLASPAFATCTSPLTGNDGGGTARTFGVTQSAGGDCYGNVALVDGTNAANKMTVKAASTAPVAADQAAVVTLSQNAGLGAAATPMQVSLANTGANATAVLVNQPTGTNLHSVVDSGTITTVSTVTNLAQMNGVALLMGNGVTGTGSQRVTIASDNTAFSVNVANANANGQATAANSSPVVAPVLTVAGAAVVKGGVPVVNGASTYQHVAASQTGAVLQTSTGAIGDYLSHCVIYPVTTAAGSVTVFDNANAAATNVIEFATGTLSNLAPITIPIGAVSTAGAWKVTTGTNETVVCYGKFS